MKEPRSNLWAEVSPYPDEALELDPQQREPSLATRAATEPVLVAELRAGRSGRTIPTPAPPRS